DRLVVPLAHERAQRGRLRRHRARLREISAASASTPASCAKAAAHASAPSGCRAATVSAASVTPQFSAASAPAAARRAVRRSSRSRPAAHEALNPASAAVTPETPALAASSESIPASSCGQDRTYVLYAPNGGRHRMPGNWVDRSAVAGGHPQLIAGGRWAVPRTKTRAPAPRTLASHGLGAPTRAEAPLPVRAARRVRPDGPRGLLAVVVAQEADVLVHAVGAARARERRVPAREPDDERHVHPFGVAE